jgi:hypothetical protein
VTEAGTKNPCGTYMACIYLCTYDRTYPRPRLARPCDLRQCASASTRVCDHYNFSCDYVGLLVIYCLCCAVLLMWLCCLCCLFRRQAPGTGAWPGLDDDDDDDVRLLTTKVCLSSSSASRQHQHIGHT